MCECCKNNVGDPFQFPGKKGFLCQSCARSLGIPLVTMPTPLTENQWWAVFLGWPFSNEVPAPPEDCPGCGTSVSEILYTGCTGCPSCYQHLEWVIRAIASTALPVDLAHEHGLALGQVRAERLAEAIYMENYELAAILRDQPKPSRGDYVG